MLKPVPTFLILVSTTVMVSFQACSGVGFNAGSSSSAAADPGTTVAAAGGNQNCTSELQQITTPVKLLFVLDTSGSNSSSPGTDPNKVVRGASVQQFFSDYGSKSNFSWGMITFSGDSAPALINSSSASGVATFSNTPSVMQAAITKFLSLTDGGNTPYGAALAKVTAAITGDTGSASTKYIVVFLSDGVPDPAYPGGDTQLDTDIAAIYNLKAGQVSFNTVYYGPADTDASTRLSNMATAGHGQFLNTSANPSGTDFSISDLVTVPGTSCTK